MSFNSSIPLVTDPILLSQSQLKANFQAINNAFSDNHVGLTEDPEFSGMHNQFTFQPQSGDPATDANQIAVYNKLVSSVPELFYRANNSQTPVQLTYPLILTGADNTGVALPQQFSFIPGPFIIFFGEIQNPPNGTVITLAPGTSLLFVDLSLTLLNGSFGTKFFNVAPIDINTPANSFTIKYAFDPIAATFRITYYAIGV